MKSKTSFFNGIVLKKDFTRFLPAWLIYLIGGLLVSSALSSGNGRYMAESVQEVLSIGMSWISCGYAIVVAILLWDSLFNSRMCNMLHALPLRREGWFFTHFTAGMLMSLLPNLVIALTLIPTLGELWYTALIWLGGSTLMYLFFFSLATLCVMATGNRFAAVLMYGLANFFSFLIQWVVEGLILPYLVGVRPQYDFVYLLSPAVNLMGKTYYTIAYSSDRIPVFAGFGDGWGYLFLLAALGLGFGVLALWLYRRRKLEAAGDFAAIAPTRWVVSVFGSIGCGMFFRLFSDILGSGDPSAYLMLFIGVSVGFFLLQMLLQRNVKVLNKKTVIKWVALVLCFTVFILCGALDVLGFEDYVPKAGNVESVIISDSYLADYELKDLDNDGNEIYRYFSYLKVKDPAQIETVLNIHRLSIKQAQKKSAGLKRLTLHYRLKDGRTLTRTYYLHLGSAAYQQATVFFNSAPYLFGVDTLNALLADCTDCMVNGTALEGSYRRELLTRMWADAESGMLSSNYVNSDSDYSFYVDLGLRIDGRRIYNNYYLSEGSSSYKYAKEIWAELTDAAYEYSVSATRTPF